MSASPTQQRNPSRKRPRSKPKATDTTDTMQLFSSSAAVLSSLITNKDERTTIAAASISSFFVLILWFIHSALDEVHQSSDPNSDHPLDLMLRNRATKAPPPRPRRAILLRPLGAGQGQGNHINGLLSAHMLADEFDRIVCISPEYTAFLDAFTPYYQSTEEKEWCDELWTKKKGGKVAAPDIRLINYAQPPSECRLRKQMEFAEGHVTLTSNTYPRWSHVSRGYFLTHYQPKPLLLSILPWRESSPPDVVVHLRKPDGNTDKRKGLDDETFHALGKALPSDTFLVTNSIEWYDWFAKQYGWRNPNWHEVSHSAIRNKQWGARSNATAIAEDMARKHNITVPDLQNLQLWSDWYTMVSARTKVLHTHSDFSLSAIHWMNTPSQTIMGMRNATRADEEDSNGEVKVGERVLDLIDEEWIRDGETPRLIDRPLEALKGCTEQERSALREEIEKKAKKQREATTGEEGEKGGDDLTSGPLDIPSDLQKKVDSHQYVYFSP